MDTNTDEKLDAASDKAQWRALLGQRIRSLRGRRTRDEIAAASGIHLNTLKRYESGEGDPDTYTLLRLALAFGVSIAYLLGYDSEAEFRQKANLDCFSPSLGNTFRVPPSSTAAIEGEQFVFVPHFDTRGDATFALTLDECVTAMVPLAREFIRQRLGITHNRLALVDVPDMSMEPLLRDGDTVLLDTSVYADLYVDAVPANGFYVLDMGGTLMIRRLQRMPGRCM